jgi:hypothetical protein
MKIKLQERHLCFVTQHLSNIVAGQYFKLLSEIRDKVKGQGYQPTDEVEVNVEKNELYTIYNELGQKPEYLVTQINREMKQMLSAQFTQKITAYLTLLATLGVSNLTQEEIDALPPSDQTIVYEGRDTQWVVAQIAQRDAVADQYLNAMINEGRNLIS